MNTIAAQDIKRRGMKAVDEIIEEGPVHVIKNNRPQYVILSEELYNDLIEEHSAAYVARVRASLKDAKEKRVHQFKNAEELLRAIEKED
jgi:PHD/YefM family antitoxin component YafN of YafNO toxin-antitoxin module